MLIAQVMRTGWGGPRRFSFPGSEVALYKGDGLDVVLDTYLGWHNAQQPLIAMVHRADQRIHVNVDALGAANVYVNGQRLDGSRLLAPDDELRVALFRYRFSCATAPARIDRTPYAAADPTEQALLDELAHDPAARVVYADWLEQAGDRTRAEFLRVQSALAPSRPADQARLAALAAELPTGWRELVADPPIESCEPQFTFKCPKQWAQLAPTAERGVRHCGACDRDVHYAISVGEARRHARLGHCVALDVTSARWDHDLAPPYDDPCESCGAERSPAYADGTCDHCGHTPPRRTTVGVLAF